MLGKIVRAEVGRRIANRVGGNRSGVAGAVIGAATPWLLRRAFTPAGFAIAGAYAAKKVYDKVQERRRTSMRLDEVARPRVGGEVQLTR